MCLPPWPSIAKSCQISEHVRWWFQNASSLGFDSPRLGVAFWLSEHLCHPHSPRSPSNFEIQSSRSSLVAGQSFWQPLDLQGSLAFSLSLAFLSYRIRPNGVWSGPFTYHPANTTRCDGRKSLHKCAPRRTALWPPTRDKPTKRQRKVAFHQLGTLLELLQSCGQRHGQVVRVTRSFPRDLLEIKVSGFEKRCRCPARLICFLGRDQVET